MLIIKEQVIPVSNLSDAQPFPVPVVQRGEAAARDLGRLEAGSVFRHLQRSQPITHVVLAPLQHGA